MPKVNAVVSARTHKWLKATAQQNSTTVYVLVAAAVEHLRQRVRGGASLGDLRRDKRRKQED